ncbi:hypothetical protein [Ammoniphilus sp. CFH 90114]|uniref:hypothetical protein n=1 Tax=Ammoniphilus sp. CFH 90114 TaxID=2493665 RepID=UPI00100E87DE|nr:hypothetical protein [Ammoniphilus sp. CFH 90114]RXT08062.1 hypothetical protein EIZ39_11670 [Ammoniphilus sp. CFH 90114]
MEWTNPSQLPSIMQKEWTNQTVRVTYTQWEDEDLEADEVMSEWDAQLISCTVSDNRNHELDGVFEFRTGDGEEIIEIVMDFPPDGEDVIAVQEGPILRIFGNEATLYLQKK